jgi:8-oxo-dGTP pyrophosphatase MutT (NUDIX family)
MRMRPAAALREAREEIGLDPGNVDLLAELPTHETVTGYTITPVLARVRAEFQAIPEDGEVAEVFRVPLDFLMRPANYRVESRAWRGQRRHYYVAPYGTLLHLGRDGAHPEIPRRPGGVTCA